ncbi:hypothetical protein BKA56DRAFT_605428 [Ilyonectria sp. MPI-CAGE-AT-0026]|nr:hypothetical protein BKA56DRAFT_605428 [Ilyonectria sp. MPI-CAGE-AT-0026]
MSFEKNDLTKERDFFADAKPPPTTAEGKGQMVYWVDCCVKIYKTSDPRKSIRDMDSCDGEGRITHGTTLWFGRGEGTEGRVKEV